jgi:hypothetical protein
MTDKPHGRFIAFFLATLLFLLRLSMQCQAQPTESLITKKLPDKILITAGTNVLFLLSGELSLKKNIPKPFIRVVRPLVIAGETVVAAGTAAEYSIYGEPPRRGGIPGKIGFEISGVSAVSGEIIPLWATYVVSGEPASCDGMGCALNFFSRGNPGQIQDGLLLIASVATNVELNREAIPVPGAAAPPSPFPYHRLHIYQLSNDGSIPKKGFWDNGKPGLKQVLDFSLDGKRLNTNYFEYACTIISPGQHVLRVDDNELDFQSEGNREIYIRIMHSSKGYASRIQNTAGYDFENGVAFKRASLGFIDAPCFEPLPNMAVTINRGSTDAKDSVLILADGKVVQNSKILRKIKSASLNGFIGSVRKIANSATDSPAAFHGNSGADLIYFIDIPDRKEIRTFILKESILYPSGKASKDINVVRKFLKSIFNTAHPRQLDSKYTAIH